MALQLQAQQAASPSPVCFSVRTTTTASSNASSFVRVPNLTSSFVTPTALKIAYSSHSGRRRARCGVSGVGGGGALGAQMNIFDSFMRIIRSYANAVLSSFEDPEKIIDQAVLEMNNDLTKMRHATAQVLASQKQLENKCKADQNASDEWHRKAQLALKKGDEDLAREALKRRKTHADNANFWKAQLDQQKAVVDNLVSNTRLLESKIQEAKSKKQTLKARAQSAKTASMVNQMLGKTNTSSALAAFEKMEEKVMAMESQVDGINQLTNDYLEREFAMLESTLVDDDLENLKKELSGSSKKGELPPARTPVATSTPLPFRLQDSEIEIQLMELRQGSWGD